MTDFTPHPGVHRPWAFICGADPEDAVVSFTENPPDLVAARLLEDIGGWYSALRSVQKTAVPAAVTEAMDLLHEAVCGWTDWTAGHRIRHAEDGQHDQHRR